MPRKITIFEPHFHDAKFGPTINDSEGDANEDTTSSREDDVTTTSGMGALKYLLFAAVVAGLGGIIYRRLNGEDGLEIEIEELDTEEATASQ